MKLSEYLAILGDDLAAQQLGITPRAARSYRTGTRIPRPTVAAQIVKRSKGRVTFEDIYSPARDKAVA